MFDLPENWIFPKWSWVTFRFVRLKISFSSPGISWTKYIERILWIPNDWWFFVHYTQFLLRYTPYAIPHMMNKWLANRFCSHGIQLIASTHLAKPQQQVPYLTFEFTGNFRHISINNNNFNHTNSNLPHSLDGLSST